MNSIVAKQVSYNQFWILKQNHQKIGNVTALGNIYQVKINNRVTEVDSINILEQMYGIVFESSDESIQKISTIRGYRIPNKSFNVGWDVKLNLPLFTLTPSSVSWHVAGWFEIKKHNRWKIEECPKLIYLQRYVHKGPFLTKEEINECF